MTRLSAGLGLCALLLSAGLRALDAAPATTAEAVRPGDPLPRLDPGALERFRRGREAFETAHTLEIGLGPLFNDSACNRCHNRKGVGGAGIQSALLAGRSEPGRFDPLRELGGPAFATASITLEAEGRRLAPRCALPPDGEPLPAQANVIVRRRTTPLFGLGLEDATSEATFRALADKQPAAIRGRLAHVADLASGVPGMGKFGWKAQAPSLHQFAGLALSQELGITNPEFPAEQLPLGDASALAACDLVPGLEEDAQGVQHLVDFLQLLAPAPALPLDPEARRGDRLFTAIGCDGCHSRSLRSGPSSIRALSQQSYAPYSDFLLHDMGALGDGIAEGDAAPREMRTAPLWGGHLYGGTRLLHDGRARSFEAAITAHDGQGAAARQAFAVLGEADRKALIAFLSRL
jgi:CxxC motif-containing protein (DUF1111 family)